MKPTNKLRAISEQALKILTTRHTRLVPTERSLPDPQMLKDFLQLDLPLGDPRTRRLDHAADIWDLRAIAKRRTPKGPFDYVDGGAEREISMARSQEVFDNLAFRPGVLRDVENVSLLTTLCGTESAMPLAIAPTGFTRMMHTEGECAGAIAAQRAGTPFNLSTMTTTSIEEVTAAAPNGRRWFQLYLWKTTATKHTN